MENRKEQEKHCKRENRIITRGQLYRFREIRSVPSCENLCRPLTLDLTVIPSASREKNIISQYLCR